MTRLAICICVIAGLASSAAAGPLHDAVKDGDITRVKLLIAQGADVNERQFPVGGPLHYAAISGNEEIAKLLLAEGAEVNLDEPNLGTPLKMAALRGNEAVAVVLIANGADVLNTSGNGTTPLHAAAEGGHASMVELLIKSGADVNARSLDKGGVPSFPPVHSAGQFFHFDIVDLLRAYGARGPRVEPVVDLLASAVSSEGATVFNRACQQCHAIEQGGPARAGPNLWGVLGRKKSSVENFKYSHAFGRLVGTWTPAEFNAFIAAPLDYVPGTNMHQDGVKNPMDRANLIAFLRQNNDDPPPLPYRP